MLHSFVDSHIDEKYGAKTSKKEKRGSPHASHRDQSLRRSERGAQRSGKSSDESEEDAGNQHRQGGSRSSRNRGGSNDSKRDRYDDHDDDETQHRDRRRRRETSSGNEERLGSRRGGRSGRGANSSYDSPSSSSKYRQEGDRYHSSYRDEYEDEDKYGRERRKRSKKDSRRKYDEEEEKVRDSSRGLRRRASSSDSPLRLSRRQRSFSEHDEVVDDDEQWRQEEEEEQDRHPPPLPQYKKTSYRSFRESPPAADRKRRDFRTDKRRSLQEETIIEVQAEDSTAVEGNQSSPHSSSRAGGRHHPREGSIMYRQLPVEQQTNRIVVDKRGSLRQEEGGNRRLERRSDLQDNSSRLEFGSRQSKSNGSKQQRTTYSSSHAGEEQEVVEVEEHHYYEVDNHGDDATRSPPRHVGSVRKRSSKAIHEEESNERDTSLRMDDGQVVTPSPANLVASRSRRNDNDNNNSMHSTYTVRRSPSRSGSTSPVRQLGTVAPVVAFPSLEEAMRVALIRLQESRDAAKQLLEMNSERLHKVRENRRQQSDQHYEPEQRRGRPLGRPGLEQSADNEASTAHHGMTLKIQDGKAKLSQSPVRREVEERQKLVRKSKKEQWDDEEVGKKGSQHDEQKQETATDNPSSPGVRLPQGKPTILRQEEVEDQNPAGSTNRSADPRMDSTRGSKPQEKEGASHHHQSLGEVYEEVETIRRVGDEEIITITRKRRPVSDSQKGGEQVQANTSSSSSSQQTKHQLQQRSHSVQSDTVDVVSETDDELREITASSIEQRHQQSQSAITTTSDPHDHFENYQQRHLHEDPAGKQGQQINDPPPERKRASTTTAVALGFQHPRPVPVKSKRQQSQPHQSPVTSSTSAAPSNNAATGSSDSPPRRANTFTSASQASPIQQPPKQEAAPPRGTQQAAQSPKRASTFHSGSATGANRRITTTGSSPVCREKASSLRRRESANQQLTQDGGDQTKDSRSPQRATSSSSLQRKGSSTTVRTSKKNSGEARLVSAKVVAA